MGSRMPGLPFIHRMDMTLHPFWQNIFEKYKFQHPSKFWEKLICFQTNTKTKMAALARSIDSKPPRTIFIEKSINIEGLGKNRGSIMHPYFWVWTMYICNRAPLTDMILAATAPWVSSNHHSWESVKVVLQHRAPLTLSQSRVRNKDA